MIVVEIVDGPWIDGHIPDQAIDASASVQLYARNAMAPVRWEILTDPGDLPDDFAISSTGLITFTADEAGSFSVVIRVTDSEPCQAEITLTWRVIVPPLQVTGTLDNMTVASAYSDTLTVQYGVPPYSFYPIEALPAGIAKALAGGNASPVTVSGTPTGVGLGPGTAIPFVVTFIVQDSIGSQAIFSQSVTVNVPAVTVTIDGGSLPNATVGVAYSHDVDATGGVGSPYIFTKIAGPSWLTVDETTGALGGTPSSGDVGTGISVTVRATDGEGNYGEVTDTFDVAVASIDVTTVFKAHTYTGNGVDPRTLTGIDLSGGGVFLLKIQLWHQAVLGWSDGTTGYWVYPESNVYTPTDISSRFVAGGYQWSASDVPAPNANHSSAPNYVIETFKKAASFADVVHYSGTGSAQNISHSLGKVPAMILVKRRSGGGGPITAYHVGLGNNAFLNFDSDGGGGSGPAYWDATDPSATVFRVGTGAHTNESGYLYSAMLFAHDPTGVIQGCSWTGDGTANGPIIDLGWEPQFILTIPNAVSIARNIYDTARDPGFSSGRRQPFAPPGSQQNVSDFTLYNSGGVIGFRVHHTDSNGLNVGGRSYYAIAVREP